MLEVGSRPQGMLFSLQERQKIIQDFGGRKDENG